MITKRKRIGLFIGIILIYFTLFCGSYIWHNIYSTFLSKQEIVATSAAISSNETDALIIINKIAEWLKSNVKWDTTSYRFLPFYMRKVNPSASWVMSVKRGACEENAILFAELARNAAIESLVIYNPGEDHVWNEVWINGSWRHFDATLSEGDRFDNLGFYERSRDDGGWGKQLSYVYSVDSEETIRNVTNRYTNTGVLVVDVKRDGLPIENVNVMVQSRFLMETKPESYKQPLFAAEGYTGRNGRCSFSLGENNYTVFAQRGDEKAETSISLLENTSTTIILNLTKSGVPLNLPPISLPILATSLTVTLASLFTYYFVLWCFDVARTLRARAVVISKLREPKLEGPQLFRFCACINNLLTKK